MHLQAPVSDLLNPEHKRKSLRLCLCPANYKLLLSNEPQPFPHPHCFWGRRDPHTERTRHLLWVSQQLISQPGWAPSAGCTPRLFSGRGGSSLLPKQPVLKMANRGVDEGGGKVGMRLE